MGLPKLGASPAERCGDGGGEDLLLESSTDLAITCWVRLVRSSDHGQQYAVDLQAGVEARCTRRSVVMSSETPRARSTRTGGDEQAWAAARALMVSSPRLGGQSMKT
jgi:hypothetical protein